MFLLFYLLKVTELVLLLVNRTTQQSCLVPADSHKRATPFRDDNRSPHLPSGTQAIITSYQFQCCGNITEWRTFVQPGGGRHRNGVYSITFQVWRPSPAVATDGCYSLVGENVFPSITLLQGGEVSETPTPTSVISVQPGDVVGYFTQSNDFGDNEGIQLDEDYTDESVWYHINTDDDDDNDDDDDSELERTPGGSCPFPVGSGGRVLHSSTNAAPVLSVLLATFPCPSSPSPAVMMTSSEDPIKPTPTSDSTDHDGNITSTLTTATMDSSLPVVLASVGAAAGLLVIVLLAAVTLTVCCTAIVKRKSSKYNSHPQNFLNREIQRNNEYITTAASSIPDHTHNSNNLYASNNERDTRDMKMQGNDAYSTSRHIPVDTDESYATTIPTDLNQAYAAHDMNTFQESDEYEYVTY